MKFTMKLPSLNSLFVGKVAIYLDSVNSTNTYAKNLLSKSNPTEGTVIFAAQQSAGRGQIGSKWNTAPKKNIIMSTILFPKFLLATQQFQLNKVISLAVMDTIQPHLDATQQLLIKWPNDIYVNNKKLGGILIENSLRGAYLEHAVVGIGLNINQLDFDVSLPNPTSLSLLTQKTYNLETLLSDLCTRIEYHYLQLKSKHHKIDTLYLNYLLGYNEWRNFLLPEANQTFEGKITGVSKTGKLQVSTKAHPLEFDLKEIKFLFD